MRYVGFRWGSPDGEDCRGQGEVSYSDDADKWLTGSSGNLSILGVNSEGGGFQGKCCKRMVTHLKDLQQRMEDEEKEWVTRDESKSGRLITKTLVNEFKPPLD